MTPRGELPTLRFASASELERWLEHWHERSPGLWLQFAKKGTGVASVTYAEAVELALCFGWIDGQRLALDATFFRQRFTPRGPRSRWSQINRDKATALAHAGRMRPAGSAQVARATADGRWEAAYPGQRSAAVPDDLQEALAANPAASASFATLDSANRYAILYRVHDAKRPATRAARIARYVEMLVAGERLHP